MGHDIDIVDPDTGEVIWSTRITGNFSSFNPNIRQIHGHPGRVIHNFLKRKLARLAKRGIVPNSDLGVDGWGQYTPGSPLLQFAKKRVYEDDSRKGQVYYNAWADYRDGKRKVVHAISCMHAYHMQSFLEIAKKYPNYYWYSDQVCDIQRLDGDDGQPRFVPNMDSDSEPEPKINPFVIPMEKAKLLQGLYGMQQGGGLVYCYIHPVDGNKTIQTWEDAMEACRFAVQNGDECASAWAMMALIMKGEI